LRLRPLPRSVLVARACPMAITARMLRRLNRGGKARAPIVLVSQASPTDFLVRGLLPRAEVTPHPTGQLRRRSADAARACRIYLPVRTRPPRVEDPPHRRLIADVGRACRTDIIAPARDRPAPTSIQPKRWHSCIAPPKPLFGQTPARIFTTSAATTITAPPNVGPICASGTRSRAAYAWRRMKNILEPRG
jgi:hypothetical protein